MRITGLRFGIDEVPLSVKHQLRFHTNTSTLSASEWYDDRLAKVTGSSNTTANNAAVGAALDQYYTLHRSIFGVYSGRLPPEPKNANQLAQIRG